MMKIFQAAFDKNSIIKILTLLSILLIIESSCKNRNASLVIHPKLVFTEFDTSVTSVGNTQIDKSDYYLIKDFSIDKMKMKPVLDSFVNTHPEFKSPGFGNYVVFFYLADADLNEATINQAEPKYRYKIFNFHKDDNYIVSYTFRDSKVSYIDWSSEY